MKVPDDRETAVIDGLTREQVVRSIADCQRKAAKIGLTPSAEEKNMLMVYRTLYENRKALLESLKEGHPELWTDFLDPARHPEAPTGDAADQPDEAKLLAEISHYRNEAAKHANQDDAHEQNLHLAYALLARHRGQQLDALRQAKNSSEENPPD